MEKSETTQSCKNVWITDIPIKLIEMYQFHSSKKGYSQHFQKN